MPSIYNVPSENAIIEEEEEEDQTKTNAMITKSINDEIDSILHHYAGNAVDNVSLLKQKDIVSAQKRAKQRLKQSKKKQEIEKEKTQKKERQEKVKKKKELARKRKREIQSMHQKKRKTSRTNNTEDYRLHTTAGISYSEEGLGQTEPDPKQSEHTESEEAILQIENTSSNIEVSEENGNKYSSTQEATNEEIISQLKAQNKHNTEGQKSRYSTVENDGFEFEYEDDFEIEDPQQSKLKLTS